MDEVEVISEDVVFEVEIVVILGMAIDMIIDKGQKMPMMLKLKFIRNKATLDITNNTREILIFDRKNNDRYTGFKIFGLLQDKTRSFATEFK